METTTTHYCFEMFDGNIFKSKKSTIILLLDSRVMFLEQCLLRLMSRVRLTLLWEGGF